MSAGDHSFKSDAPLLARWRSNASRTPSQPPRLPTEPPPAPLPPVRLDPRDLLAELQRKAAAEVPEHKREKFLAVLEIFLQPLKEALSTPPAERDVKELAKAFDRVEDFLEAFLLARRSERPEG